jgi:hypothetical protein
MTLLEVTPDELCFPPPLDKVIACILRLRNTSGTDVAAFKVKTTAPRRYCVRPNSGYVHPGEEMEVHILLQPVAGPGAAADADGRSKDNFLVESVRVAPERAAGDVALVWPTSRDPAELRGVVDEVKLRCYFMSPEDRARARAEAQGAPSSAAGSASQHSHQQPASPQPVTARGEREQPQQAQPQQAQQQQAQQPRQAPQASSAGSGSARRLEEVEATLVLVSKDRDQLHDTLEEAATKLEQVLAEKRALETKLAAQPKSCQPRVVVPPSTPVGQVQRGHAEPSAESPVCMEVPASGVVVSPGAVVSGKGPMGTSSALNHVPPSGAMSPVLAADQTAKRSLHAHGEQAVPSPSRVPTSAVGVPVSASTGRAASLSTRTSGSGSGSTPRTQHRCGQAPGPS